MKAAGAKGVNGVTSGSRAMLAWLAVMLAVLVLLSAQPVQAQVAAPPENPTIDAHQVNLPTGEVIMQRPGVAIGPGNHHGLSFSETWVDDGWRYNEMPTINGSSQVVVVTFMGSSMSFVNDGSNTFTPTFENGATLTYANSSYTYTSAGGVEVVFDYVGYELFYPAESNRGHAKTVTFPDGVVHTFHYDRTYHDGTDPFGNPGPSYWARWLTSITSNTGYQISLTYSGDPIAAYGDTNAHAVATATAINNAEEYCDPTGDCTALTGNWPQATYANGDVTNHAGDTTDYEYNGPGGRISAITRPGGVNDTVSFSYDGSNRVSSVQTGGGTWSYTYGASSTTTTNPEGGITVANFNAEDQLASRTVDGQTTSYTYCTTNNLVCRDGLLQTVVTPEGQTTEYRYNSRGNLYRVTTTDSAGANPIVTSATYSATCTNPVTCNLPLTMTNAAGQVTHYTYDQTHGGVTQVQAPAAASGQPRPTTIIEYTTAQARYRSGPSSWTTSAPITVPLRQRACRTQATCAGGINEARTTLAYSSATTPNNLQPVSVTTSLGDDTLAATSSFTYNAVGQPESVDGPVPGSDDRSYVIYDQYWRQIGSVSGDPDGTGPLPRLASRITIANGLVTRQESGTSTTTADLSGFVADQRQDIEYDDLGRPVIQRHRDVTGTTQHSVVQASYNPMGLVECIAQRMDAPLTTTSLPSACTLSAAGLNGTDRISRTVYDDYGRVLERRSAEGTSLQQVTQRFSYRTAANQNGQLDWAEDAEGNRTQYVYDAFGRHYLTRYPSQTSAHTANPNDTDRVRFDAFGRVDGYQARNGRWTYFTRDNLGRITRADDTGRTGLDATHSRDIYYGYDLFGNLSYARFDSHGGQGITNSWNALGQLISTTNNMDGVSRTLSYGYDTAGRRTSIRHPDNIQFLYDFDPLGRLTSINRAGQADLWSWTYTDEGRMASSIANASAPDITYGFDAAGRLDQLLIDHPTNNTYDVTHDFTFNPAGQVTQQNTSNALFDFNEQTDASLAYQANGLNQYTQVTDTGAQSTDPYSYDPNGNLTSDSETVWTYDNGNRLVQAANVAGGAGPGTEVTIIRYDPLGRMYEVSYDANTTDGVAGSVRRLYYDGYDLVLEYGGNGSMMHRYVHGVSAGDDPLVQYNGSNTGIGAAQFLYTDRLGSVTAIYNRAGTVIQTNTYDEFGTPASTNGGRFQYTGQQYVPELGLYYYKARMYSPTIGRFMQTDPIGYADGMNMYAYVGNDPVNGVDPYGLCTIHTTTTYHWWVPRYEDGSEGAPRLYDITYLHEKEGCDPQPNVGPGGPGFPDGGGDGPGPDEDESPCIVPPDVERAYRGARRTAFAMFTGRIEIGYAIFRSNTTGALHTSFTLGIDGQVPNMRLRIEGQTLVLTGHIHNRPVGSGIPGTGSWNYRGPSPEDIAARDLYNRESREFNLTRVRPAFVLHQQVNGVWEDICYTGVEN